MAAGQHFDQLSIVRGVRGGGGGPQLYKFAKFRGGQFGAAGGLGTRRHFVTGQTANELKH
jgi:hypothetical protein